MRDGEEGMGETQDEFSTDSVTRSSRWSIKHETSCRIRLFRRFRIRLKPGSYAVVDNADPLEFGFLIIGTILIL